MICAISVENAHLFGDVLAAQHRLRYRVFVERAQWKLPSWRGMEYDQFDTPAAVYVVWRDAWGQARGVTRLLPTVCPYMIRDLWPDLLGGLKPPSEPAIWEATRFGVDRGLDAATRRKVIGELVCGSLEYGLEHNIREYLCVMPLTVIKHVLIDGGCPVDILGGPVALGAYKVVAGRIHISEAALARVMKHYGLVAPVLDHGYGRTAKAA